MINKDQVMKKSEINRKPFKVGGHISHCLLHDGDNLTNSKAKGNGERGAIIYNFGVFKHISTIIFFGGGGFKYIFI